MTFEQFLPAAALTALICIDMQHDFVNPTAPAAVAGAVDCVSAIERAARAIRERGVVIWMNRAYEPDGSNVERSRLPKWRRAPFVVSGTAGAEMVPELGVAHGDIKMIKPSYSAFFGTDLEQVLTSNGIEHVVLCGVDLARCVRASAVDALSRSYLVTVLADGTSTRSESAKTANLEDLVDLGAVVVTSAALANDLAVR